MTIKNYTPGVVDTKSHEPYILTMLGAAKRQVSGNGCNKGSKI